jgi:hypothetical protein
MTVAVQYNAITDSIKYRLCIDHVFLTIFEYLFYLCNNAIHVFPIVSILPPYLLFQYPFFTFLNFSDGFPRFYRGATRGEVFDLPLTY